jgi:hypothetical protein
MDKCVIIRSITGCADRHDAVQCMTGWPHDSLRPMGGRPSIGAVLSKVQGPADPSVPPFVGLAAPTQHRPWSDAGQTGFLGASYAPFKPEGNGMADMRLNGISVDQLGDRRRLIQSFDNLRRDIDINGAIQGIDAAQLRAIVTATASLTNSNMMALRPSTINFWSRADSSKRACAASACRMVDGIATAKTSPSCAITAASSINA